VHALARALSDRGNEVHVFTSSMDGPGDLVLPAQSPTLLDGVHVHYFPVPMLRRLCWCPSMATALKAMVRDFDVMHLHSVFQWPTYAAARIAAAAGVPYLLAPRGMLGNTVIRGKSRFVKSAWIRLIEQRTLEDAAGVHVTTELEAREVRALGLRLPPIYCIPNSVSWPARHLPLEDGPFCGIMKPYVLFLSRIDWKKGLDRLVEAWRWVPELTLVIAGNDEEGYWTMLKEMAAKIGVLDRIVFVGAVTDQHKWALYEHALLFVLPSYSENFGNVVAEAMAMGCPVVVTPEVGLADLVRQSGAGVVSDGTPRTLAEAIVSLAQDPARRSAMGASGRVAARRQLSADAAAERMEAVYRHVCACPSDAARQSAA
jgi:glycosyltransferase involved in cell wall biosynthesis